MREFLLDRIRLVRELLESDIEIAAAVNVASYHTFQGNSTGAEDCKISRVLRAGNSQEEIGSRQNRRTEN